MRFSSQIGTVSAGRLKSIPHPALLLVLPTQAFTQRRRRYVDPLRGSNGLCRKNTFWLFVFHTETPNLNVESPVHRLLGIAYYS
jgi:hypothetical protein